MKIADFKDVGALGSAVFLRAAIEQRRKEKRAPGKCLHFPGALFSFLCGESHDRDEAERNRGALRNKVICAVSMIDSEKAQGMARRKEKSGEKQKCGAKSVASSSRAK